MIHKKANFGKTKDIMVCEMGTGDVWMLGSERGENGETILAFKSINPPKPIGVKKKSDVSSFDEMKPELVFIFNKIESIDSLIGMLSDCKGEMQTTDKQ